MSTIRKDNKKLKQLYEKSKAIKSAIPHPLTKGIIHECGGKMHLAEELYNQDTRCLLNQKGDMNNLPLLLF